jgi:wyosine [tRNA(Phe)-imidazoG37] synthetase (radical SAM superfamily)
MMKCGKHMTEGKQAMKFVFGPVPSRRLGQSLGIDTIPLKTCNWNCVYCQLGRTVPLTNKRREYVPWDEILTEVEQALAAHPPGEIDWITFVGSGEPALHSGLGWLIRKVKALTDKSPNSPRLPVAVITNGTLCYLPEVREALSAADAVLPSLDAGNARLYRKINRPHPDVPFERLVDGLAAFREQYSGSLWVEVMLVRGLNDGEEALREIASVMERIRPDEVHINLPTRPPAEPWVQPPDEDGLMRALAILGEVARVVHPAGGSFDLSGSENVVEAILGIITRHPMSEDELRRAIEKWNPGQADITLSALVASGRAQVVERYGARFWSASPAHYPAET